MEKQMEIDKKIAETKKTKIQFWLNTNLLKRIDELRTRKGLKRNQVLEWLLEDALT